MHPRDYEMLDPIGIYGNIHSQTKRAHPDSYNQKNSGQIGQWIGQYTFIDILGVPHII